MPLLQISKTDESTARRVEGFLNICKGAGPTSHDVVAWIRKALTDVRVGHGGTLDPAAEGVLPICLGGATKYFDYLLESRKVYSATIRLGVTTSTQDRDGDIVDERPVGAVDRDAFAALLARFEGDIDQIPPMFSARRHQGRRLYELARAGIEVERTSQKGKVYWVKLLSIREPDVKIEVECGRGTYVRTLCHDIGQAWGTGGHLAQLTRKAVGVFRVGEAIPVQEAVEAIREGRLDEILIPVEEGLSFLPSVSLLRVPSGGFRKGLWVAEGVYTRSIPDLPPGSHVRLVDGTGRTLALARLVPGEPLRLQVRKVIQSTRG